MSKINFESIKTDSDMMDLAEKLGSSEKELYHRRAKQNAKGSLCEGCKHIEFIPNLYPCNNCIRLKKDMYEKE